MRDAKSIDLDVVGLWRAKKELALHLQNCIHENDPGLLAAALGAVARVDGFRQLCRDTGIRRSTLYRLLAIDVDPSFSTSRARY